MTLSSSFTFEQAHSFCLRNRCALTNFTKIAMKSQLVASFSVTKIALSLRNKNRLCKRVLRLNGYKYVHVGLKLSGLFLYVILEQILKTITKKVASGELEDASSTIGQMGSASKERKKKKSVLVLSDGEAEQADPNEDSGDGET